MTEYRVFLICFIISLSLYACGDDDNSFTSANHGVSGDKELNTLTQEEVDQICEDNRERAADLTASSPVIRDSLQLGCTIVGLATTLNNGTKAQCESTKDDCIQTLNRFIGDAGPVSQIQNTIALPCPPAITLAQCDALVADLDACTNERLTAYRNALREADSAMNSISCNNAGQPFDTSVFDMSGQLDIQIQLPEACTELLRQCPGAVLL
jgi:hypothetical protein